MKHHMKREHSGVNDAKYKCNLCEFSASSVDNIWNHKLDNHTGEYFNVKTLNNNERKDMLFSLIAEQNVELMEEVLKIKKGVKEVLKQFTYDVENHMNEIKDGVKNQNTQTANAIAVLTREVMTLQKGRQSAPKAATSSSTTVPSSQTPSPATRTTSKTAAPAPEPVKPRAAGNSKPAQHKAQKKVKTSYQLKKKVLLVGDSLAQNLHFPTLEMVTNTTIRTAKGYSSAWDKDARFKHLNITDVSRNELNNEQIDRLVLAAPTVDISNLATNNIKPGDDTEYLKEKVRASCLNMLNVAENALAEHNALMNVTIMTHAPRNDTCDVDPMGIKHNLAIFANSYMLELWLSSPHKDRIFIGNHTLDAPADVQNIRQTDERTGRYDGVHYYGGAGQAAYLESVVNILLSSFHNQAQQSKQTRQSRDEENHSRCPQANYMKKNNQRKYSSVVTGHPPLKTSNRFSPLNKVSENY